MATEGNINAPESARKVHPKEKIVDEQTREDLGYQTYKSSPQENAKFDASHDYHEADAQPKKTVQPSPEFEEREGYRGTSDRGRGFNDVDKTQDYVSSGESNFSRGKSKPVLS